MIQIEANKEVDIHVIQSICQVKLKTERKDIAYYLKNLRNLRSNFSNGEINNILNYLEYLGLIKNGSLTPLGEKAIETNQVMIPEAGVYQIIYIKDKIFGNGILNLDRVEPSNILEGNIVDFEDYEIFNGKYHKIRNVKDKNEIEFWIKFEKQKDSFPKILNLSNLRGQIEFNYKLDDKKVVTNKLSLKFKFNENSFNFATQIKNFDLNSNLSLYERNWNPQIGKLEVEYEDIKDNINSKKSFQLIEHITTNGFRINQEIDESFWELNLSLPIIPKNIEDAEKWMIDLTMQNLSERPRYLSKIKLKELHDKILKDTPILLKFPSYYQTEYSLMDFLEINKDKTQYLMVQAVNDLLLV